MAATTFCKRHRHNEKIFAATYCLCRRLPRRKALFIHWNYDKIFSQGRILPNHSAGFSVYNDVLAVPGWTELYFRSDSAHHELDITLVILYLKNFNSSSDRATYPIKIIHRSRPGQDTTTSGRQADFFKAIASPVLYLDPPSWSFLEHGPQNFMPVCQLPQDLVFSKMFAFKFAPLRINCSYPAL